MLFRDKLNFKLSPRGLYHHNNDVIGFFATLNTSLSKGNFHGDLPGWHPTLKHNGWLLT